MATEVYVSPENFEVMATYLRDWIISKLDTAIDQLVDGAPEALDTLKEISDYISTHKDEYDALLALVGDKASQSDLTALQNKVTALQTSISGSSHTHNNMDVLNATTASFTAELLTKLNALTNITVDTTLSTTSTNPVQNKIITAKINTVESAITTAQEDIDNLAASFTAMTDDEVTAMFNRVFSD